MKDVKELYIAMQVFINRWLERIEKDDMTQKEQNEMYAQSRAIGQAAWELGGVSVMSQLHAMVPDTNYFPRVVDIQWNRIGTEKDVNEGWNA